MDAMPSGSYLVLTHSTSDFALPEQAAVAQKLMEAGKLDTWPRGKAEITELFRGLWPVEPGLVHLSEWRPEADRPLPRRHEIPGWAVIARKR
ncbi:SAM-dependent methyltransferase [Actinoplanes sp. NPDC051470]|uniref:SAM-dependent methyltransferase n=1 Tax=Actinoplanes sp. NPDC051470 TaxID=3157224 RepID=UPI00343A78D5